MNLNPGSKIAALRFHNSIATHLDTAVSAWCLPSGPAPRPGGPATRSRDAACVGPRGRTAGAAGSAGWWGRARPARPSAGPTTRPCYQARSRPRKQWQGNVKPVSRLAQRRSVGSRVCVRVRVRVRVCARARVYVCVCVRACVRAMHSSDYILLQAPDSQPPALKFVKVSDTGTRR